MNNLEEMKAKFEKELAFATKENEMEERFGCEFFVFERFKASGLRIAAKKEDINIAREMLKAFPADEEQPLDSTATNEKGNTLGLYKMRVARGYTDTYTKLTVSWLCNGNEYEFHLRIDGNAVLEEFFLDGWRKMSDSEISTYKPDRNGGLVRYMELPIKSFRCYHIKYYGGSQSATDTDEINSIINAILNA